MTTATLGFEIRSEQAATAKANLDKMTAAADQAELAQKRLAAASTGSNAALARIASGVEQANVMLAKLVALTDANSVASTKLSTARQGTTKATIDGARSSEVAAAALRQEAIATDQVTAAIRRHNDAERAQIANSKARASAGLDVWGRSVNEVATTRNAAIAVGGAANQNRTAPPLAISATAQGQVAQAEAVTRATSTSVQSLKMLGAGLAAAILPVSILQFGIFALASAATEWATSMLTGADKTEKALERHKKWIDEITAAYPRAAEAAKAYEDEAKKLPFSVVEADTLQKAKEDQALLQSLMSDLAVKLETSSILGAVSSPADRAAFAELAKEIKDGTANAEAIQKALGDIRLDPSTTEDAREYAKELKGSAQTAAELEARLKGVTAAASALRGVGRGESAERLKQYGIDNAESMFRLRQQRDLGMMGVDARSPAEKAALARAREEAKPVTGLESVEVRKFREDTAAALAFAQAQHMIDEAQKQRARSLDNLLAGQQLDTTLIGKTAGEAAKLRMEFDLISQVREEAARNGIAADEAEIASIKEKAAELGRLVDLQARLNLNRDLDFERSQLFLSRGEQEIASRLRGTGIGMDSPEAQQMREMQRISDLRDGVRGFFDDFEAGLMRGDDFGKSLGNAVLNALMRALDSVLDNALTSITNSIVSSVFGASAGGGAGKGTGDIVGSIAGALAGRAANNNYAPGAVTRSPLPDIGSTFASAGVTKTGIQLASVEAQGLTAKVSAEYASRFQGLFNDLNAAGYKIKSLGEGGYSFRNVAGTSNLSKHSFGEAIDINPRANPWSHTFKTDMPSNINEIAKRNGLTWGGTWNKPDTMHFQVDKSASAAAKALEKLGGTTGSLTRSTASAAGGLDKLSSGMGKVGDALSKFPAAPGGGGGGSLLSGLFGGGLSSAFSGTAAFNWLSANPGGYIGLYADGGPVSGPGTGTSDSVPAMLSNGEYVVKASAASKYLPFLEAINDNRIQHRANGGPMGRIASSASPMGDGGRPNLTINHTVEDHAGVSVRNEQNVNDDGSIDFVTIIEKVAAESAGKKGGMMNRVLERGYGAKPALRSRG